MVIARYIQELGGIVGPSQHKIAVPGIDCHVGQRILSRHPLMLRQMPIQHVQLALGFHRIAVDRVFLLGWRIGVEMPEASAHERRGSHLPEEPAEHLGPLRRVLRDEGPAELFRQVEHDRGAFEHPLRRGHAMIHQRRYLGIRVHFDKARTELFALADVDQPGVVFGVMARFKQLFQQDRDLHAIWRGQ